MAAPTGYSVPVAQGTGLGCVVQGYLPNQTPNTMDPNALPPLVPSAPSFPASTGTADTPRGSGIPPSAANGMPNNNNNDNNKNNTDFFDEPDIFIPGPTSSTAEQKKDNNDDDDGNENNAGGGGDGMSDSYTNLAARFSQLQK